MNLLSPSRVEGDFVKAVQVGKVKGPQQRGFSLHAWRNAYEELAGGDVDHVLFTSGVWFDSHFGLVRAVTELCAKSAGLCSPLSIAGMIAVANREWLVANKSLHHMLGERERIVFDRLDQTPISTASGNPVYFTNVIDTMVDGVRFPLALAGKAPAANRTTMSDEEWNAHVGLVVYGGYYHILEHYWMSCVWNGYGVEILDHEIRIRPFDDAFHRALTVSLYRRNARYHERAMLGGTVFRKLRETGHLARHLATKPILSLFKKGGAVRVKADVAARFPDSRAAGPLDRTVVFDEHLAALTAKRFPCLCGLSINQISDAFELLGGLPEQLAKYVSKETVVERWSQAAQLVPKIRLAELTGAVRNALKLSEEQTKFIFDYATWKPDPRNEIWFTPLIPLDAEHVSFVCLSIDGVNTIRLCDQIIADFPDLRREADDAFEEFLRAELARTFGKSKLTAITRLHPRAFKPKDPVVGDIDLLFRIGQTVWVGEAKSVTNTFSAMQDYRLAEMLRDHAVPQAQRKAVYVAGHLAEIAALLDLDPAAVKEVRPVVVTSNAALAGFPINGVPVVDWHILELFFSDGSMRRFGYTTDDGRRAHVETVRFYISTDDAEQRLPEYLLNPPQIATPRQNLHEDVSEMLPAPFFKGRPVRVFNYTVKIPTESMEGLIEKVAEARGDWRRGRGPFD